MALVATGLQFIEQKYKRTKVMSGSASLCGESSLASILQTEGRRFKSVTRHQTEAHKPDRL